MKPIEHMWRRGASRALAVCSLAVCALIYTCSIWTWDPILFVYPFVGPAAAAPFVLTRLWLMRDSRADRASSALEALGLGLLAAPMAGLILAVLLSWRGFAPACGVGDPHTVATILRLLWPVWIAGEALLVSRVAFRARALASLPPVSLVATIFTLIVTLL
jgi:hypothetical protein